MILVGVFYFFVGTLSMNGRVKVRSDIMYAREIRGSEGISDSDFVF